MKSMGPLFMISLYLFTVCLSNVFYLSVCPLRICLCMCLQRRIHNFPEVGRQPQKEVLTYYLAKVSGKLHENDKTGPRPKYYYVDPPLVCVCVCAVADLHSKILDAPRVQILSISCSFWEILAKSYVGAPPEELMPPPWGNPRSATGVCVCVCVCA